MHIENIKTKNPDRAQEIEHEYMMNRAIKRAGGEKVKDDVKKLKKSLHNKEAQKRKSEKFWKVRDIIFGELNLPFQIKMISNGRK